MNPSTHNQAGIKKIINKVKLSCVDPLIASSCLEKLNLTASARETQCLTDYGRFHRIQHPFWLFEPGCLEELIECLNLCVENNISFSCRGAGHSMNGRSLPPPYGLLISTLHLNRVSLFNSTDVVAECGVQVLELDHWLRTLGYQLPVVHDGGLSGPTLGGFISAGGFGCSSDQRGGFWNHIKEIKFWQKGTGVISVTPDNELFYEICGSGQPNGFILSAVLNIDCIDKRIDLTFPLQKRLSFQYSVHPRLLWFTFIMPLRQQLSLRRELIDLHLSLGSYWKSLDPYQYKIKFLGRTTPPGFHAIGKEDLIASGVWGEVESISDHALPLMLEKVNGPALRFEHVSRYWQSEL